MDKALIDLLEEKAFEYITVSEICKKAGVNRSTFYLHYENTHDLLEEAAKYFFDGFLKYFSNESQKLKAGFQDLEPKELIFITEKYLYPYLSYIKENDRVFLTMLSNARSFGFDTVFKKLFEHIFDPILDRFRYPPEHRKYVMMFYLNGITAIVLKWVKEGCKMSVEELSKVICESVFGLDNLLVPENLI